MCRCLTRTCNAAAKVYGTGPYLKFIILMVLRLDLPNIIRNPVVMEIAKKYNKSPAQILLRHLVQKEMVVIPRSVNPSRIKENINVSVFYHYLTNKSFC